MPETVTTFNTVEKKAGSNDNGPYTLHTFTDVEGKKFKTFKDDVAEKAERLMGSAVAIEFTVKSRQWDGRTLVDNMIDAVRGEGEMTSSANGAGPSAAAPASPVANRIFAFKAAVDLLGTTPEMFGEDTPNFVGITKVADAIFDWASRSEDKAAAPDPEPEPEPVSN